MTEVKLELSTNIDMLPMIEKGISEEICHATHWYVKANKYVIDYDKNKPTSYLKYWDVIFYMVRQCCKNFP